MTQTTNGRSEQILAVARAYENVANFSVDDVVAAARKVVPDVDLEELAIAFETLAEQHADQARAAEAEVERRTFQP